MERYNWTLEELVELYNQPLLPLVSKAQGVHAQNHAIDEIQTCTLISIKTGGCPEDCKYCAQSSRYQTAVKAEPMMGLEAVLEKAKEAVARGSTRVCLGAAWKLVRDSKQFDAVLKMVKEITDLKVEVCCTLGCLNEEQAEKLKQAGLFAYNHNLDSSEKFYKTIITTRSYQDRLDTLNIVEKSGLSVCCGGIIGMGETFEDRLQLLVTLGRRNPHPESVPINQLVPISGTPLGDQKKISTWEVIRMIALTRIVMPKTMVRLSAGRMEMSFEAQALCIFAGANSIFYGEKLLTVGNPSVDTDEEMLSLFGLKKRPAFKDASCAI